MNTTKSQVLALIPARGGSKGITKKNIRLVAGVPLITYSVDAARNSGVVDRVIVTTDCPEIAEVARLSGAETPFLRPTELARDETPGIDPLIHAIKWLEVNESYVSDYIMCLQPTSPLRSASDVADAMALAEQHAADAVVSVVEVTHHPFWSKTLDDEQRLHDFITEQACALRRQELPPVYALNGAIYIARRDVLLSKHTWYTDRTYGYVMPAERSLDIDTPWDLHLAELILCDTRVAVAGVIEQLSS